MSTGTQRTKGKAEEVKGKVKAGVGKAIGNERMEAEGRGEQAKGVARQESAKAAERAKGATEATKGKIKEGVGSALGNERMKAEGKVDQAKGNARQTANR